MKYNHLAVIFATAVSLSAMTNVAQAGDKVVKAQTEAVSTAVDVAKNADDGRELDMFRFSLRMEKIDFVRGAMKLDAEQEKKFMAVYYPYDIELKKLSDKRLALIKTYADKFDAMTPEDADKLAKGSIEFRKQRGALLEKYYGKMAKATSKITAARFLQIENILQATTDVKVGSLLPLLPPQ